MTGRGGKRTLVLSSLCLLHLSFAWSQLTTLTLGPKWGYVTGLLGYWAYCLVIVWVVAAGDWSRFVRAWQGRGGGRSRVLIGLVAFIPVAGVFVVAFRPNAGALRAGGTALLIVMAVSNGTIEELYWRWLYLIECVEDTPIGLGVSSLLFGAWHVSVWFAGGVVFTDGGIALIGGAYATGLLWSWVARAQGNIRAVASAHVLVNPFAFTSLFVDNGF